MNEEEKTFDTNDIISCFKMSVDVNGIEKIEEYINKLEQENKLLKEVIEEAREYIKDSCYYPELENYSNMTYHEVKQLLLILDKVKGE